MVSEYVLSDGGAQVRRAMKEQELPACAIMCAQPSCELPSPFMSCLDEAPGGNSFFLVVFGVQSAVLRHFAVLLPTIDGCEWEEIAERASLLRTGAVLTTDSGTSAPKIKIRFGDEPIVKLREFRIPPTTETLN